MFPILYDTVERNTSTDEAPRLVVPQHHGLGVLSDCISCEVEQERNGIYELSLEYPASGIHAKDFALRRIIKAKPNFTDNPQLFRIDRIGKTMNGQFTVYAKHISYDISGYVLASGNGNNATSTCVLFTNATHKDFKMMTTKEVTADFVVSTPASVRSFFAGKEGSFLDIFGTAEIKYDNFVVNFMESAGADRGVTIRYGKNLLELSQEMDCSNLRTHVLCYYKEEEGSAIVGAEIPTGLVLDEPNVLVLDVTQDFQTPPEQTDLNLRAEQYIADNLNSLTVPSNNVTLDFVQSGQLVNRVDLCDTVTIYYEALGVSGKLKCIRTKWDCLRERYIETEFGDVKKSLSDTISESTTIAEDAGKVAAGAASAVGSKKRVFVSEPVPPYDEGDLWVDGENIRYCANAKVAGEEYEISDWLLASDYINEDELKAAINGATQLITGGLGGNVVIMTDLNGRPYEIVIFKVDEGDPVDLDHAHYVWRWNEGGLGYSSTGYYGTYDTAITSDGKINASMIMTGELDASLVNIQHLTAAMFEGQKISIGGKNNQAGVFELRNENNVVIGEMDKNGLKFYGEGPVGNRPYVLLNNSVGFAGFDASGAKIFWVNKDEFHMKKCVAETEINACGKLKMVAVAITESGTVVNEGVAFVALV